ncbi:hypothetical protein ILUMI_00238 [Ignelater luminosus]|uniref:BRISC and BRCA1-A complex member 2 n=1 Tax=Ignelater luminosus TaxID=2038154 RepID=A0A8K0DHM7_IGNLU|nr:hypothetical protein ILUMI_00238 [Ignelater luminosus]
MDDISLPDDHVLLNFPPRLRKNIKEIWKDGKIGISSKSMKVHVNPTKASDDYSVIYKDNFILEIPYAGRALYWEVMFKDEDYGYPPDFDFPNDSFLFDPDIDTISAHMPSLANWNINNSKSLISVIRELMVLYKKYQISRLQTDNKYSALYTEYQYLISETNDAENIEVYIDNGGTVHFFICINISFSDLPPYVQPMLIGKADNVLNPNEDTATLRVALKPDSSKVQSDLQLSPRLEQVIGSASTLHIPTFNKDSNNLLDYISQITTLLEERVEQISNNYKLKNEYISFIISVCGCNIIEYDSTLFSKVVLLCEVNNFYTLVLIQIGNKFPQEKPKVTLRSIYHLQHDKPFVHNLDNYPYSPRWTPEEMVKRLITNLKEEIPNFQVICQKLAAS